VQLGLTSLQTASDVMAGQSQTAGSSSGPKPINHAASTQLHPSFAIAGPQPTSISYSQEPVPLQYE
jgi:hypothetical protein